jgi:hypothetical protein
MMDPTAPPPAPQPQAAQGQQALVPMAPQQTPELGPPLPQQGAAPPPVTIDAVIALLRDDRLRGFRIDVETDSLIEPDQQAEKQARTEFVAQVGEFIAKVGPIAKEMPPLAPLVGGLLQFAVRGYKVGQELEELIETTMQKAGMLLMNPPPPQPTPDEMAKLEGIKVKAKAEGDKAAIEVESSRMDAAAKMEAMRAAHEMKMAQLFADHQRAQKEHELRMAEMVMGMEHEREKHAMAMEHNRMSHEQALEMKRADSNRKDRDE